jgi:hypothetical protein
MDRIDLEVTPIKRAVRVVMIGFATAPRVLGAFRKRNAARGAEFIACVLLESREAVPELVSPSLVSLILRGSRHEEYRRLESNVYRGP